MCGTLSHPHLVSVELSWLETIETAQFYSDVSDQASGTHTQTAAEQSVGAGIQMGLGICGPALTHFAVEIRVHY
jgi:hypothetical protein